MFDARANNLGESGEEVDTRSRELIATNESAVVSKPVLDPIMVEHSKGDGCFPNAPCADESNGLEVFSESDDLLDQFVASEAGPAPWGRRFSQRDTKQM